jgi:uncharacterized protein
MNKEQNIAAVKGAYEAFIRGDIKAVLSIMDQDVNWTTPGQRELVPFAGQFKGRAAVAKFFEALAASEVELIFEPREFVAEGDSVVAFVHYWVHAKATGRTYEGEGVHFYQFRNEKVASFREFFDPALIGSAPMPGYAQDSRPMDPVHCKFCN